MKYKTEILNEIDYVFVRQWRNLWDRAENSNPFNSHDWLKMNSETINHKENKIYVSYEGDKLVAVLPLTKNKCFGVPVYCPLGYKEIVNSPFLLETIDKYLIYSFFNKIIEDNNIYLPKVDTKEVSILNEIFPEMFFPLISVNPYINIGNNPLRYVSKSNIKLLKKRIKSIKKRITFRTYDYKYNLDKYLEVMFKIDSKSAKSLRSKDIFSKEENKEIFKKIVTHCGKYVCISFLYYDKLPIAYSFNFIFKNTFLGYQMSYLRQYKDITPGKLIIFHLLNNLKRTPFRIIDFCGGLSSYKMEFVKDYYFQHSILFSRNPLIMSYWKAINRVRRFKQNIYPEKHSRDHEFLFKTFSKK